MNKKRESRRRGQVLVEFALILPLLILVILGVVEFGRLFYGFSTLQNAARHAADVASKAPPHLGEPVPDDPYGRVRARDSEDCGQEDKEPCFLANIRDAARDYAVMFSPSDPSIQVYFLPKPDGTVGAEIGGLVEVQIEYDILPITPILRGLAPLGVTTRVDSRRTIVNVKFPAEELLTPLPGIPTDTPLPTIPIPGCGGKYTTQGEAANGKVYSFQITNVSAGDGHGIVGLVIGWDPDLGQLESVAFDDVQLPGTPANPPTVGLGGGSVHINNGATVTVRMTFAHNLNPVQTGRWPSWHLTFDDYCQLWSAPRDYPYPTPTNLPTLTPTNTPPPEPTQPWVTGTVPPLCGMRVSSGPSLRGDSVWAQLLNGGTTNPNLSNVVAMWGPGDIPLTSVRWNGVTVWTGAKYYSAYMKDLVGDFPAGSTRDLEFLFGSSSIRWISFQVAFDNDCFVSYHDANQPTLPPLPTLTPTPVVGWIYLDVDLSLDPPDCAENSITAHAVAYYPWAGSTDGAGIQNVVFRIYDPHDELVYEKTDTSKPYCMNGSSGGNCNPYTLNHTWPYNDEPIITGTYRLDVIATTTSQWGSYHRTVTTNFDVCYDPCSKFSRSNPTRPSSRVVKLTIYNNDQSAAYVSTVHIASWPSVWGSLDTVKVRNNTKTVNAPVPPPEVDVTFSERIGGGSSVDVTMTFHSNVDDPSQVHGYILLSNGCQVRF